ncbi:ATP nucleotide 3'-pyrophosphokinase [Streptomyces sp. NPDC050636]|uniref:ATP nucleotide 3'-pyrophosphokinase n=1 Tax=Streptomyces sp. NPDC050636 TaxID=3154510 RepID=UPI003424A055
MRITTKVTRAVTALALSAIVGLGLADGAQATSAQDNTVRPSARSVVEGGGWQGEGGLSLSPADNARVDAYVEQAKKAERSISPQVRAAAVVSAAEVVGFDRRLKSPDSLKRKVATSMKENPGQNVGESLARISDSVRYTLQWPDHRYSVGVTIASHTLAAWGNDSTKWTNRWNSGKGYKGLNTGWRAPRSGHPFEIQFHTPTSKWAQEETHKLYEEQRLPTTTPERAKELQEQQDAIFAMVPVPPGADHLTAPRVPGVVATRGRLIR